MQKSPDLDELSARLRVEFRDDAQDRLNVIYDTVEAVKQGRVAEGDAIVILIREASKLRGIGTSFGVPMVTLIAHRFEAYVSGLKTLPERQRDDAVIFADRIAEWVDRDDTPDVTDTNQLIRALPVRYEFDITDVEVRNVEIMLVTPSKVVSKLLSAELAACGFRSIVVHDPIESIALAVRLPPDMIIASAVMDHLGGIDLLRGLAAMTPTRHVPMALLTSLDHIPPNELPSEIAVIRNGSHFSDDFAAAITRFNLG